MFEGAAILHADLDAFYASVEQLLDPSLRGRPIAVGGSAAGGVVLAASYEAKRFGVSGGMPGRRARELCPHITFVRGHFDRYQQLADSVMAILGDVTPEVERISIDEAFLDVSGSVHLFGPPDVIADRLRRQVRREVGLPISIGVARTKHLAKVASQVAKPDGLVVVAPEREREFLAPLPVGLMWGIGPVAQAKLKSEGIVTIGQLAEASPGSVQRLLGNAVGQKLSALAVNEDRRRVSGATRARSVGAQSAMGRKEATPEMVRAVLNHLADRVAVRLRAKHRAGRTITVRVRYPGMKSVTRSLTLNEPVAATLTLTEVAEQLAWQALNDEARARGAAMPPDAMPPAAMPPAAMPPDVMPTQAPATEVPATQAPAAEAHHLEISLLAISVSNLVARHAVQQELAVSPDDPRREGSDPGAARLAVDTSMDAVRAKYGRDAVGYLPAMSRGGVPDEFRELAEKEV
ncbi:DNA polymerase IV [Kineosporia succinea]|uniref:DNA polymerase IV n=1 Tax=Kineosporia succinea TaxID=84632 RepID=A0ABT9NXX2_9ACTN|nr:DNA polymerase IV [Kineosporia succinea]MDP9825289.1 DNA polymerase-4 [Kineosporia succinea]